MLDMLRESVETLLDAQRREMLSLVAWYTNLPTDADVEQAKRAAGRPDVATRIAELNTRDDAKYGPDGELLLCSVFPPDSLQTCWNVSANVTHWCQSCICRDRLRLKKVASPPRVTLTVETENRLRAATAQQPLLALKTYVEGLGLASAQGLQVRDAILTRINLELADLDARKDETR
jgi:hypothetical protein